MKMHGSPEALASLYEALAKAQGDYKHVAKASEGARMGGRSLRYADLGEIDKAIRAALAANGLAVVFLPGGTEKEGHRRLSGLLTHAGGAALQGDMDIDVASTQESDKTAKLHPEQVAGKAVSYARRHLFAMLTGAVIVDADDLDKGAGAGGASEPQQATQEQQQTRQRTRAPKANGNHSALVGRAKAAIKRLCGAGRQEAVAEEMRKVGASKLSGVPAAKLLGVVEALEAMK